MEVSVITPVYNAATFVTRSVESALQQPETAEVLLVEDDSPDNSLEVCQRLAAKYEKVKLLRHADGENHGAGASRNLGMKRASCEYIAFLDADDYYLPGRFSTAKAVFENNPDCEGVYEAINDYVEDELALERWNKSGKPVNVLSTMTKSVKPENLAEALIAGQGRLTLDGLVIKRSVLDKSGFMAEELRLHQDTEWIIRVAAVSRLLPGKLNEAVALRGVHDHNRISAPKTEIQVLDNRLLMWLCLYKWFKPRNDEAILKIIMDAIVLNVITIKRFGRISSKIFPRPIHRLYNFFSWLFKHTELAFDPRLWQSLANAKRHPL